MDEYYIFRNAWYLPLVKNLSPKNKRKNVNKDLKEIEKNDNNNNVDWNHRNNHFVACNLYTNITDLHNVAKAGKKRKK